MTSRTGRDGRDTSTDIPCWVRDRVLARDAGKCRVCGETLRHPALHHVIYGGTERGIGGRRVHDPDEIITVGNSWPDRDCHSLVHSQKDRFTDLLLLCIRHPGRTALQLERWASRLT